MAIGYPDMPIETIDNNEFNTATYVKVLSNFIRSCDTPMTIAIQGDWGTGKTSMMNMIMEELKNKDYCVFFNTWQYSQFNLVNQLPLLLINKLVSKLSDKKSDIKSLLKKAGKLLGGIGISVASKGTTSPDFSEFELDQIE